MSKVYLLLRNNKQSGPYSLEEISAQQLKPLDLVWIEGKSAAWKYASEVTELTPFLPESGQTNVSTNQPADHDAYLPKEARTNAIEPISSANKIHVSLPANARPKKETPVQPVVSKAPEQKTQSVPTDRQQTPVENIPVRSTETKEKLITKYSSTLEEKEEAYTEWIYKSKSKKNTLAPEWIGGIAVIVLLMMGSAAYYIKNKSGDKAEITQSTSGDARAVEELTSTAPEPEVVPDLPQPTSVQEDPGTIPATTPVATNTVPPVTAKTTTPVTRNEAGTAPVKSFPSKQQGPGNTGVKTKTPVAQQSTQNSGVAVKDESKTPAPTISEPVATGNPKSSKTSTPEVETTKQKKTFSEKVDGFFNKVIRAKKVEPGVPVGSPEPVTTEGERKAVRRGETTASEPESVKKDLSAGIQLTTIEPTNTWMQGVHGLRMKIENRNDVKVSNASVEVKYLNEQNAVIDKKTIRLSSIAPGKQIMMDIPDHRLADHATATLISAGN